MEVIKLQSNKYGLATRIKGKMLIISASGEPCIFPSRKEAELMVIKIQRSFSERLGE